LMPLGHRAIYKNVSQVLDVRSDDDVVDIACGSGYFLKNYACGARSIAGLDLSELMVELAARRNRRRVAAGTAEFVHGEASKLPWDDNRFSAAVSMGSLIAFSDPGAALKEMCRVLRPGGRAVVSIEWHAEDGLDHTKKVKQWGMRLWGEREVWRMMEEAGFSELSVSYWKGLGMPRMMIARGVK